MDCETLKLGAMSILGEYGSADRAPGTLPTWALFQIIGTVSIFFLAMWVYLARIVRAAADDILVISGKVNSIVDGQGKRRLIRFRFQKGGATFVWPFIERVDRLSLALVPVEIGITDISTSDRHRLIAEGIA